MGSKLKKIALPLAAVGLMAATGGAGGIGLKGLMGAKKGLLLGKAATGASAAAAPGSLMGSGMMAQAMGGGAGAATSGLFGTGGKLALSKGLMAKGLMSNLAAPLTAKGMGTYGALGMVGKGLMGDDKQRKLDTSKDDDQAQAAYDYHMMMSKGIMSPEDARTAFASYGKGMKGDYTPGTEMGAGRYEELYPQLNYTGLTKYNPNPNEMLGAEQSYKKKLREYNPYVSAPGMANGGRIGYAEGDIVGDDELSQRLFQEIYGREESPDIEASEDMMNFSRETQDLNKQRMEENLRQYQELLQSEEMNMGGRVGLRSGGEPGTLDDADEHSFRMFDKPYRELNEFELEEFDEEMSRLRSKFMADGGLMQVASAPDPMGERFDMLQNLAFEMYKRPLEELQPKEIEALEGMIEMMDHGMADGGSVPQTESIPQGMQLDGRGGGFIPMGAKEKHDDVPAMLAKNEFVMTSDAVKAAGGGSVNKGAQVMYDLMNSLESKV